MNDALLPLVRDAALESLIARVADDYLERLDKGEQPELEEYIQHHPELTSVLPQVLPALRLMRSLSAPQIACEERWLEPGQRGCLGDFRLLREIGPEAWALSMKRSRFRWIGVSLSKCFALPAGSMPSTCNASRTKLKPQPNCTMLMSCRFTPWAATAAFTTTRCNISTAKPWLR